MDAIEGIKSRLDVVDTVAEYLQLKPAGSGSFKACCPFHQEKTPSFFVNRPRQSWHCFGCDQGGDVISFVQKMEGMDFPEALEFLAHKAGVTLPKFNTEQSSERKRLQEVNDLASKYFRTQLLQNPHADGARAYVAQRGLDELTCDLWKIGYAPEGWSNLSDALRARGVTDDELIRAGLAIKRDASANLQTTIYDRFRHRLMITICDQHGHVVGFTGRVVDPERPRRLSEESKDSFTGPSTIRQAHRGEQSRTTSSGQAKYVNTPETILYKKSHILFGLDKAKGEIKRQNLAVIVEGNMDVIASHQFDVTNVVASSGTALTSEQLNLLKRFTTNIAIAFDTDAAGNAATIRGLDIARGLDCNVRIITLPSDAGKDPDDAIRKNVAIWQRAIQDAQPIIEWLYRDAFRGHDASKPEEKKKIAATLLQEFRRISNAVERDAWVTRLARDLVVGEEALREEMRRAPATPPQQPLLRTERVFPKSPSCEGAVEGVKRLEMRLLAILFLAPDLRPLAHERLAGYPVPESPSEDLVNMLAILADREFQDQSSDALQRELDTTCALLHDKWITAERTRMEEEMRAAELAGDETRINDLLARFEALHSQ